jgi:hypothetical protein
LLVTATCSFFAKSSGAKLHGALKRVLKCPCRPVRCCNCRLLAITVERPAAASTHLSILVVLVGRSSRSSFILLKPTEGAATLFRGRKRARFQLSHAAGQAMHLGAERNARSHRRTKPVARLTTIATTNATTNGTRAPLGKRAPLGGAVQGALQ